MKRQSSFLSLFFLQTEEDYIPYPSVHEVGRWYAAIATPPCLCNEFSCILVLTLPSCSCPSVFPTRCILWQVLGRKSPFPLILLPQFGGYWIEGTNHELSDTVDSGQLQPLSPNTRTKLECNTTASLYRKHFLGKVSYCLQHTHGLLCNSYVSVIPLSHIFPLSPSIKHLNRKLIILIRHPASKIRSFILIFHPNFFIIASQTCLKWGRKQKALSARLAFSSSFLWMLIC